MQLEHRLEQERPDFGTLRELWTYRELFYFLAWRDIKVRYKQTSLGVLWAVIQPLFTMVLFTLLFGQLANIPSDGLPRPVFYFAALLPWTYVSTTVNTAAMSLVSNSNLLTKIYFPRLILPASATLSGLLDFLIGTVLLAALVIYFGVRPGWALLLWPLLVVQMVVLSLGAGMFLAALNVQYRDVKYAVPFAIQLWMFITPIIYPSSMIPAKFQWLLALNPLTGLIEAFRFCLDSSLPVHWDLLGISIGMAAVLLLISTIFFKRMEQAFADVI